MTVTVAMLDQLRTELSSNVIWGLHSRGLLGHCVLPSIALTKLTNNPADGNWGSLYEGGPETAVPNAATVNLATPHTGERLKIHLGGVTAGFAMIVQKSD